MHPPNHSQSGIKSNCNCKYYDSLLAVGIVNTPQLCLIYPTVCLLGVDSKGMTRVEGHV